jgi:hypothetical protein
VIEDSVTEDLRRTVLGPNTNDFVPVAGEGSDENDLVGDNSLDPEREMVLSGPRESEKQVESPMAADSMGNSEKTTADSLRKMLPSTKRVSSLIPPCFDSEASVNSS